MLANSKPAELALPAGSILTKAYHLCYYMSMAYKDLFYARGPKGAIIGETKDDVFAVNSGNESPDHRAHWPITNRIPDVPDQAFAMAEQRRLTAEEALLGAIAIHEPAVEIKRHG